MLTEKTMISTQWKSDKVLKLEEELFCAKHMMLS